VSLHVAEEEARQGCSCWGLLACSLCWVLCCLTLFVCFVLFFFSFYFSFFWVGGGCLALLLCWECREDLVLYIL